MTKPAKKGANRGRNARSGRAALAENAPIKNEQANLPLEARIGAAIKRRRLEANLTLSDLSSGAG